jgi:hypothetical protein
MAKMKFQEFKNGNVGELEILNKLRPLEKNLEEYLAPWSKFSQEDGKSYPSQGLLRTPHDYLEERQVKSLPEEMVIQTLRTRRFFLEKFNHEKRLEKLQETEKREFVPPGRVRCRSIEIAHENGVSLSAGDLGATVTGTGKERISRNSRYNEGPFVKLGKHARTIFVGSASPDVWNSSAAIATMAMSHCLAGIPRNGVTSDVKRQADLAAEVLDWIEREGAQILHKRGDKKQLLSMWKRNLMGTLEANPEKALIRAIALYTGGVRCFRVYSHEPGTGPVETVKVLRRQFKDEVEIFAGQIVDVSQAKLTQEAGADGIFVGVGGGGRCITGVRSGSAVDWPDLVWDLRGELKIPVIVEGGASDHVAVTLLLGGSGISVSRVVSGGTIESPGGWLYCVDNEGRLFKPYGGEASARAKFLDGKLLPFNIPAFVEGETARAYLSYVPFVQPTLTYNLHMLLEDAILALVFRGVASVAELQALNPSPLRQITGFGEFQRNTH